MKKNKVLLVLLCVFAFMSPSLKAQNLYVGSNTSGVITNLPTGTSAYSNTYVGYNAGTSNNYLGVSSNAGAILVNTQALYIGYNGSSNTMTIYNGGVLTNGTGSIGYQVASSNNSVLVTGINSTWNNLTNLYVGNSGPSSTLTISNGAIVADKIGWIGNQPTSSNNIVQVTGSGSLWTNSSDFYVGNQGSFNTMNISNGGVVINNGNVFIGLSSSNNLVQIVGSNSLWSNSGTFYVGESSSSNAMVISNGGAVVNGAGGYNIGYYNGYSNNSVLVTGSNSIWSNGGELSISAAGNSMVISNGGAVTNQTGSIGDQLGSSNNSVLVTGSNSTWNNSNNLYVGNHGAGNSMVISNGGLVSNKNFYGIIGNVAGSSNNSVSVIGSNSIWNAGNQIQVGGSGAFNTLTISNGGLVFNGDAYIGNGSSASNNAVVVSGSSTWSNAYLHVGYSGVENSMVVSNGATVVSAANGYIGSQSTSSNNTVLITGSNSIWNNSEGSSLYVG